MKTPSKKLLSVSLIGVTLSLSAFAQTATTANTGTSETQITQENNGNKKLLPVDLRYVADFFGPSLNDPFTMEHHADSIKSQESEVEPVEGMWARHTATVAKALNERYTLSGNLYFRTNFANRAGHSKQNPGGFHWLDSYVKMARGGQTVASIFGSDLSLGGDLRYYLPTSEKARNNGTIGSVRLSVNPGLQFGKSIFSISSVNYVKGWIQTRQYTKNVKASDGRQISREGQLLPTWEFYTGPQINAQVSDRFNLFVLYEASVGFDTEMRNNAGLDKFGNDQLNALTDVEPGVDITINKHLTVTPYLNWYTSLPISTTSVNLNITANL